MNSRLPLAVFVAASILVGAAAFAGESPYRPPGTPPPQATQPKPAQLGYSYYCEARTLDAKTRYRTDIQPEPAPYNPAYIRAADQAWHAHLDEKLGKYKAVGNCYEGPTASAKPAWEKGFKDQERTETNIVRDDWRYDE